MTSESTPEVRDDLASTSIAGPFWPIGALGPLVGVWAIFSIVFASVARTASLGGPGAGDAGFFVVVAAGPLLIGGVISGLAAAAGIRRAARAGERWAERRGRNRLRGAMLGVAVGAALSTGIWIALGAFFAVQPTEDPSAILGGSTPIGLTALISIGATAAVRSRADSASTPRASDEP